MIDPSAVSRILIVGAGGFGREVFQWACDAWPDRSGLIAGFVAAADGRVDERGTGLDIICDPERFQPAPGDGLLLGIGIPAVRRRVAELLLRRGATFLSLVHPTAVVARTASIGVGSIICPFAVVSEAARVGTCTLLNYHASVAHDASTGAFAVLSPYAALGGHASIGDDVFMGMHASVSPGRRVGPRSKVSANSCALADVPADSLVYGVPGRVAPLFA